MSSISLRRPEYSSHRQKGCIPHAAAPDAAAQVKSLTSRASREGPLACQHSKVVTVQFKTEHFLTGFTGTEEKFGCFISA